MALPPRFPGLFPSYGVQIPPLTTLVPFGSPYFMPNPIMAAAAINSQRLASQQIQQPKPPSKPPVTTVFVGNINEKCSNEVIRSLLTECGAVATWKRIQGSNGKFQAFGFCEFESPYGTMRALRILHEYPLAEKKLVVKIDEKTRSMVRDYVAKQRAESGLPVEILASDALPTDEENAADDEEVRQKIRALIEAESASLLPVEDGELDEIQHSPVRNRSVERHRKEHRTTKKHRDRKLQKC